LHSIDHALHVRLDQENEASAGEKSPRRGGASGAPRRRGRALLIGALAAAHWEAAYGSLQGARPAAEERAAARL
jgi:hypothetical protein